MPYPGDKVVPVFSPPIDTNAPGPSNFTATATTWTKFTTNLASCTNASASLSLKVLILFGAQFTSSGSGAYMYLSVGTSSGISIGPGIGTNGAIGLGEIPYLSHALTTFGTSFQNANSHLTCVLPPGVRTTIFDLYQLTNGAGTNQGVISCFIRVIPLYYF